MPVVNHDLKAIDLPLPRSTQSFAALSGRSMVDNESLIQSHKYEIESQSRSKNEDKSESSFVTSSSWSINFHQCDDLNVDCIKNTGLHFFHRQRQLIIPFIWGILVGVALATLFFQQSLLYSYSVAWHLNSPHVGLHNGDHVIPSTEKESLDTKSLPEVIPDLKQNSLGQTSRKTSDKNSLSDVSSKTALFVGVITAEKFLASRATAVNNTWGSQVDGIEFYTQNGNGGDYKLPVVNLDRASDTEYPPQKKAFEMLKHICANHIDNYEWFIRADDDVYIRVNRLKQFLTTIDSERMIYMGQPGHGVPEVRDRLGLRGHNFCMGGPGVIFNRKALKGLCPHIDECMAEVVTGEEDVEIGRCVTNHIHIECTHAWETLKLFYHSYQEEYKEEKPFLGNLAENDHVSGALTLHHLKIPSIMYKVHRHYVSLQLNDTIQKIEELRKSLHRVNSQLPLGEKHRPITDEPVPSPFKPTRMSQAHSWKSFSTDAIYSLSFAYVMNDITNDVLADLKQIGETGIDMAIGQSAGQKFTYSHVSDGYLRSDYQRGTDYILDVYFNSKMPNASNENRRVRLLRPARNLMTSGIRRNKYPQGKDSPFYVILFTSDESVSQFEAFMRNYFEPVFLSGNTAGSLKLVIVVAPGRTEPSPTTQEVASWYRDKHPGLDVEVLPAGGERPPVGAVDEAYAHGVMHVSRMLQHEDAQQHATILLTTTQVYFGQHSLRTCILRTFSSNPEKSNGRNCHDISNSTSQLYQPIPFTVFPKPNNHPNIFLQSDFKAENIPITNLNSENGFWEIKYNNSEINKVIAPLCGRVSDFYESALASLKSGDNEKPPSFGEVLFDRIFSGALSVNRSPDKSFGNIPTS